jgi:hypothetical protein
MAHDYKADGKLMRRGQRDMAARDGGVKGGGALRVALAMACLLAPCAVWGAGPALEALKAAAPPKIDGDLSDECWKGPPTATGFTRETRPPTEDTRVWVRWDATALYFAFECPDSQIGQLHSQQKKRNGSLESDDTVTVGIDPLGDRQTMYWFTVNPRGTQQEEIPGGAAAKIEWRGDWLAGAKVGEKAWTAELAVPFAILKYPPGQKQFGLIFRRRLQRVGEETAWPSGTNYYTHENQATLSGVEAPKQRAVPRFMPYMLLGAGSGLRNSAGIDIKYTTPNNVTNLLSIEPDFQTIEDVIDTIDFSYNPRQLPDRRPFFTEGGDFFDDSMMFYSRSIGRIDGGVKSFGKIGRTSFGAMGATRLGSESDVLLNGGYDVTAHSDVRFGFVGHEGDTTNGVVKLAANWRKPMKVNGYYWGVAALRSMGGGADATAWRAYIDRWSGYGMLGWHVFFNRIPADYTPSLAYVPEPDRQSVMGWVDYGNRLEKGPLLTWSSQLGYDYSTHLDGSLFHRGIQPSLDLVFRRNWGFGIGADLTNRPPNHDRVVQARLAFNIRDLYRTTQLNVRTGRLAGGDYLFASVSKGFKFGERFSTAVSAEKLSLKNPTEGPSLDTFQGVLSGVYDITAERGVLFRLVANDHGFNGYAAYRQELRKGMDIFLILGDPNSFTFHPRIGLKVVNTY